MNEPREGGGPVPRLPMTAGALLVNGTIYSHTSVRGDGTPALHSIVRQLLQELPVAARERFAGWCAEAVLISDRLYEADQAAGRQLTMEEARSVLSGAQLHVQRIREDGDPAHGQPQPVCRTCAALLSWFGIVVVTG